MKRKIIKIDEEKCNGCTRCVSACHEGAIVMVDGKAKLLRDDYCDGLGDCLPVCPVDAISFEEREAAAYDEEAVKANMLKNDSACGCSGEKPKLILKKENDTLPCGCPSSYSRPILRKEKEDTACGCPGSNSKTITREEKQELANENPSLMSQLRQWPVQIKLVPVNAPYFDGANLLVAADCTAFAYANFHNDFIKNHVVLIGCPKLDMAKYADKLTEIIKYNNIKSLKVVRMEVPCCGGIENAAVDALKSSGKFIPWQVYTIGINGEILE